MLKIFNRRLPNSIKKRTLILVMSLFAFTSLLLGLISIGFATHEVEELFDARLAQQARLLVRMTSDDLKQGRQAPVFVYPEVVTDLNEYELSQVGHEYESKVYFRIWHNGEVVVASDSQSIEPSHTLKDGFGTAETENYEWRTFELKKISDHGDVFRIVVAERQDVRGEIVTEIVLNSVLPEMIGWPVIALLVWLAVGFGLEPLKQLTDRISKIKPAQLKPVSLDNVPEELAPVQQALNILLKEIDDLMAREKRWIADAAHELRTPLAILKLHAQNAEAAQDEAERQHALEQMVAGVDRSTRIVGQLLSYARVESQLQGGIHSPIPLFKETRRIVAALYPMLSEKEINLEVTEVNSDIALPMEVNHLEVILQNLISNAVKFTPTGGEIRIDWQKEKDGIVLDFRDSGVGVPKGELGRLTERFFRGSDHSGAGLGLSIVSSLVKYYGAHLAFGANKPSGLVVRIRFPMRY
ncbi:ATP-binding protein [Rhodanobacter aciditrophus]|uniref:histidine kinase n=1 Tax=Rhodanobacter aciditrophus TaxID=1623218 RepID=A0ABW4B1B8_9GAMM